MEQYLISYNFKDREPKIFQTTRDQYEAELNYQIKLANWNPNKATAEYAEERIGNLHREIETISFYDPDNEDFAEMQLIKIISWFVE